MGTRIFFNHVSSTHTDIAAVRYKLLHRQLLDAVKSVLCYGKRIAGHFCTACVTFGTFGHQPFGFVECEKFYRQFKIDNLWKEVWLKYWHGLTQISKYVMVLVYGMLIPFFGWNFVSTGYSAVFSTNRSETLSGHEQVIHSVFYLNNEALLDNRIQAQVFHFVL